MNRIHPVIHRVVAICCSIAPLLAIAGCEAGGTAPATIERPPVIERPDPNAPAKVDPKVQPIAIANGDRVIAEISGVKVTESQVMPVLIESDGLDILLKVTQLNMAKAEAFRDGKSISQADVDREREITLRLAFPEAEPADYPGLLRQLLQRQNVSEVEFGLVLQMRAYLRKIVSGEAQARLTDEMVRAEFNALYGERIRVRHVALNNMQEVAEARERIAKGDDFADIARTMSRSPASARLGGELPPFSRMTTQLSKVFIDTAFSLKTPGEVSADAVQDGRFLHIIKLEERMEPKAVKYDDVKDSVRASILQRLEDVAINSLRDIMAERARRELNILEPTLKKQFNERLKAANPAVPTNNDETNKRLDDRVEELRERIQNARNGTTTQPATTEPATIAP